MLADLGYQPEFAEHGEQAIDKFLRARRAGTPFAAVIMDLTVAGGMGGAEAVAELRRIDPDVCAIVSSGYSNDEVMAGFRDYGFREALPKPYSVEDLADTLSSVLGVDGRPAAEH